MKTNAHYKNGIMIWFSWIYFHTNTNTLPKPNKTFDNDKNIYMNEWIYYINKYDINLKYSFPCYAHIWRYYDAKHPPLPTHTHTHTKKTECVSMLKIHKKKIKPKKRERKKNEKCAILKAL